MRQIRSTPTDSVSDGRRPNDDEGLHLVVGDRRIGPFDSRAEADAFSELIRSRTDLAVVEAAELFEGRMVGDEVFAIDPVALEFGVYPLMEVWDIRLDHDNGEVPIVLAARTHFLSGNSILLLSGSSARSASRSLPAPMPLPERVSIGGATREIGVSMLHPAGGELVVVEFPSNGPRYLTLWRRDGRARIDLPVASGHSSRYFAVERLPEVRDRFRPSEASLVRRPAPRCRDHQRERVYSLESRISIAAGGLGRWLDSIEECRSFLQEVYEASGLGAPPPIAIGRANLERSYFRRRDGITLAPDALHTRVLLHEAAHHVADRIGTEPAHGPIFVATLIGMLAAHEGADMDSMLELAREAGIDVDEASIVAWKERIGASGASACP